MAEIAFVGISGCSVKTFHVHQPKLVLFPVGVEHNEPITVLAELDRLVDGENDRTPSSNLFRPCKSLVSCFYNDDV
jgi:hypothetical protein